MIRSLEQCVAGYRHVSCLQFSLCRIKIPKLQQLGLVEIATKLIKSYMTGIDNVTKLGTYMCQNLSIVRKKMFIQELKMFDNLLRARYFFRIIIRI